VQVGSSQLPGYGGLGAPKPGYQYSPYENYPGAIGNGNGNGAAPGAPAHDGDEVVMSESISPRVYKLLKTKTLEAGDQATQIQFSDVQGVGDPISIEALNREEMIRLIIVNFARLSVKSEWDGLLG